MPGQQLPGRRGEHCSATEGDHAGGAQCLSDDLLLMAAELRLPQLGEQLAAAGTGSVLEHLVGVDQPTA